VARRAEPAVRCPWCDAALEARATECPGCRLPFTLAGADGGGIVRAPSIGTGTASTATSSASAHYRLDPHRLPPSGRAHRARMVAWLLGLTAVILAVAGIASWITVSDPDVQADSTAGFDLRLAVSRARGSDFRPAYPLQTVDGASASDAPDHVSVRLEGDRWYGASQSTSGRCFVVASLTTGAARSLGGTLAKGEPCTGDQVRARLAKQLAETASP
jgi:hypothetical protein